MSRGRLVRLYYGRDSLEILNSPAEDVLRPIFSVGRETSAEGLQTFRRANSLVVSVQYKFYDEV